MDETMMRLVARLTVLLDHEYLFTRGEWKMLPQLAVAPAPLTPTQLSGLTGMAVRDCKQKLESLIMHRVVRAVDEGFVYLDKKEWDLPQLQRRYQDQIELSARRKDAVPMP